MNKQKNLRNNITTKNQQREDLEEGEQEGEGEV